MFIYSESQGRTHWLVVISIKIIRIGYPSFQKKQRGWSVIQAIPVETRGLGPETTGISEP